jgi:cytoskeletal protein RodZ
MEETAATAAPQARSIGERLRAGRERSGLSVAAAAEKLHLDNKVIEALEADRFAELGASVYVRGHLRRYADFVGEPGVELVEIYDKSRAVRPPTPDLTQFPQAERRSDSRRLYTPLVGLGAAAVLALCIWWILSGSKPGADDAAGNEPANEVSANEATAVPDASALAGLPAQQDVNVAPSVTSAPVVATAPAAAPVEAPKPEAPVRPTRLRLQLASESWIEIYDSRGERLFYDIASAGSVQSVEGRAPLRVVLGSSVGVAVEVDGRSRDIPANAVEGEGARFVVNRSGSLSRARQ